MHLSAPSVWLSNPKEQLAVGIIKYVNNMQMICMLILVSFFTPAPITLYLNDRRNFQYIDIPTTAFRFYVDGKDQLTGIIFVSIHQWIHQN